VAQVLDSNDQERERGITILAKVASLVYEGTKINVIDTPGHADFGSEVERVLNMADGVLLLVDSVEGPKPQTRFVLRKAIELGKPIALVINKMDRDSRRPEYVLDATFDLFAELGASDAQMDFPVAYASAMKRMSGHDPDDLKDNMKAVFDVILSFPRPKVDLQAPLQLQIVNIDADEYKGRLGVGRIQAGRIRAGQQVIITHPDKEPVKAKINELMVFDKLGRTTVTEAGAGDIIQFSGLSVFDIGDTLCHPDSPLPLPPIKVEEPTVRMSIMVNTSEYAGQEGKYVTSRNIRDRLDRELQSNVGLRLDEGASTPDCFEVCGRGMLHLTVLIETMRREGFEIMVGPPSVIDKVIDGHRHEPFEEFEIEVPAEFTGACVSMMATRKGEMTDMGTGLGDGYSSVKFMVPTRGLMGIKNALLTATRGTAVLNSTFAGYKPYCGPMEGKERGSLLAHSSGVVTTFGLEGAQDRGKLMIPVGEKVYANQIVGIHQRPGDLAVNICKMKAVNNIRSANKTINTGVQGLIEMSLDECIEYIGTDEVAEVTPVSVRMAKMAKARKPQRGQ
jgi:GTP-binding protein